jgi:hypothetical protein
MTAKVVPIHHKIIGGANANQKGEAAEMRTWIASLIKSGNLSKAEYKLIANLNDIVHSSDHPSIQPLFSVGPKSGQPKNELLDYTNQYDPRADPALQRADMILSRANIKPWSNPVAQALPVAPPVAQALPVAMPNKPNKKAKNPIAKMPMVMVAPALGNMAPNPPRPLSFSAPAFVPNF